MYTPYNSCSQEQNAVAESTRKTKAPKHAKNSPVREAMREFSLEACKYFDLIAPAEK